MNPLLNHPIIKQLDYKVIHEPTFDGVRVGLLSKRRKLNFFVYVQVLFFFIQTINWLIISERTATSITFGLISLIMIPLLFSIFYREGDKYLLADDEIRAEINKHEKWAGKNSK